MKDISGAWNNLNKGNSSHKGVQSWISFTCSVLPSFSESVISLTQSMLRPIELGPEILRYIKTGVVPSGRIGEGEEKVQYRVTRAVSERPQETGRTEAGACLQHGRPGKTSCGARKQNQTAKMEGEVRFKECLAWAQALQSD